MESVACLLSTPVQSNKVQIQQPYYSIYLYEAHNVPFLLTLSEKCILKYMFMTEVIVKVGVVLDYIILRAVYKFLSPLFTDMTGSEY